MQVKANRSMLAYVLSTALESGIGYWAEARNWKSETLTDHIMGKPESFTVSCEVRAQPDGEPTPETKGWKTLDLAVIRTGIERLLERKDMKNQYHIAACVALARGDEDADYDAETADCIVQLGLYNDLIYG